MVNRARPISRLGIIAVRRPLLIALPAILGAAVYGLWWSRAQYVPITNSVVLITLDTTRADRLPAYGYMGASMPHLDRLAREGIVFDRAISVAPLTLPAHSSLFTGLYPPRHGVRDNASPALAAQHITLAELFQAQGFRTAAVVGSVVLDPDRGLAQGFERYGGVRAQDARDPARRQRRADQVVDDALQWLDGVQGRFFLWTHLYDPHRPYDPPEPFRSVSDPYVGEIAFADSQIGRLLVALERRGLLDETLVVVVGDHGESLGEHGERDHGLTLYESVLRVPLIIRAPGFRAGRIGSVVRLVDLMPTVLDLVDITGPHVDGVSLTGLMSGKGPDLDLEAYAESLYRPRFGATPLRTLREARFKVIEAPRPELYDLARDPFETTNLYDQQRPLADVMIRRLHRMASMREEVDASTQLPAQAPWDLRARLSALGYVGTGTGNMGGRSNPPDVLRTRSRHHLCRHRGARSAGDGVSCHAGR